MLSEIELRKRAAEMRRNPTEPEKRLWRALSNSQLSGFKFRRQHVIVPYICDFFCASKSLIIEVDGDTHDPPYNQRRDRYLGSLGFKVLRLGNADVMSNIDGVGAAVLHALTIRPDRWPGLHSSPSPSGEGFGVGECTR